MNTISLKTIGKGENAIEKMHLLQNICSKGNTETFKELFACRFDVEHVTHHNCENLIGSVEVPVGVVGPLNIPQFSPEPLYIPLATTEGALVASVNRGCKAIESSGNLFIQVKKIGMTRAPAFVCASGKKAQELEDWLRENQTLFQSIAKTTSTHLRYISFQSWIRARTLFVRFVFDTDEAMGMNMVTIAVQAIADMIVNQKKVALRTISSNVCTDKKDSVLNSLFGRGYWVQVESVIPKSILESVLKTQASKMVGVHYTKNLIGSNLAGSFSQNAQVANVIAAFYLATGQDPAHTVDASHAFLTLEQEKDDIYAALTLPSVEVGTVGGGTYLKAQTQARKMMNFGNTDITAHQLAGIAGVVALSGELSLIASLSQHTLAQAHIKRRMKP